MAHGALPAQIVVADLIDIQGDQIHRWMMMRTIPPVTVQKPVDDVLRV